MLDRTWVSTTGDLTASASWNPAGTPIAGDNLFFGPQSQHDLVSNLTGLSGVGVNNVWFMPSFTGALGGPGNEIDIGTAVSEIICQGTRNAYFSQAQFRFAWDTDATLFANGYMGNTFDARRGHVNFSNAARADNISLSSHPGGFSPTMVVNGSTGTTLANVHVASGELFCEREITSAYQGGGYIQKTKTKIVTLYCMGGRTDYNVDPVSGATCIIHDGIVDFTQSPEAKTFLFVWVHSGGDFLDNGNLTISTLWDLRGEVPLYP